jgi:uncharacterized protein (TIGR03083 family)
VRSWFATEQREFGALAQSLSDEQWATRSLCDEWTVRDLVVHVAWHIKLAKVSPKEGIRFLRFGGTDGLYGQILDENRARSHAELVEWLGSKGRPNPANLVELILHQQDVRVPLTLPRAVPPDQLAWLLAFAMTPAGSRETGGGPHRLAAGLRLVATDLDWSHGEGPEVGGPGQALLMAICGRPGFLDALSGPGVEVLAARGAPNE